jgi:hypothetical protein
LKNTVEVDETYTGSKERNKHHWKLLEYTKVWNRWYFPCCTQEAFKSPLGQIRISFQYQGNERRRMIQFSFG